MHISGRQGWALLFLWLGLFPAWVLPDAAEHVYNFWMFLSMRWGNQLNNLFGRSVLPTALGQLDLLLGFGFITSCVPAALSGTWKASRSPCDCWLGTGEHWSSFHVAGVVCFLTPDVKKEGESVREWQFSGFPTQMGDSFKTPYRQKRSFHCFLLISTEQPCLACSGCP